MGHCMKRNEVLFIYMKNLLIIYLIIYLYEVLLLLDANFECMLDRNEPSGSSEVQ